MSLYQKNLQVDGTSTMTDQQSPSLPSSAAELPSTVASRPTSVATRLDGKTSQNVESNSSTPSTSDTATEHRRIPTSSAELHATSSTAPASVARTNGQSRNPDDDWVTTTSHVFEESIARPASEALHSFFYPPVRNRQGRSDDEEDYDFDDDNSPRNRTKTPRQRRRRPRSRDGRPSSSSSSSRRRRRPQPSSRSSPNAAAATLSPRSSSGGAAQPHQEFDAHFARQQRDDKRFVETFWTAYDDIVMLSLFTQVGIIARLGVSTWFTYFNDGVFSNESPLFVNLPLNCLSCFLMGLLASGESLMEIIATRFSPPRLQQALQERQLEARRKTDINRRNGTTSVAGSSDGSEEFMVEQHMVTATSMEADEEGGASSCDDIVGGSSPPGSSSKWHNRLRRRRRRRRKRSRQRAAYRPDRFWWEPPVRLDEELRDVQLLALERRIRQSKCLFLFSLKKEDVDVMEHYFDEGYRKEQFGQEAGDDGMKVLRSDIGENEDDGDGNDFDDYGEDVRREEIQRVMEARQALENDLAFEESEDPEVARRFHETQKKSPNILATPPVSPSSEDALESRPSVDGIELHGTQPAAGADINQMVNEVSANVSEGISRLRRANLADGWDVGTTPEAMSDDLMLGLRLGFCGALSSFSSWNSAMINLIREGHIGDAIVGYMLGIQLPIVAYRFGQHVAVYSFIWRCRRETKRDERRGYGIRVAMNETSEREGEHLEDENHGREAAERETPSIRAVATALFIMALVTQCTSIFFYLEPESQVIALSLLFSPLGVIARWRLARYNNWRPTFPLGTFVCNILACALSGGLGTLLAGNPGERERLVLVSFINGFGGTLSSVAAFIVEILAGIDPVLLRVDGAVYAFVSIFWAMVVGFLFTASADWADETG